MRGEPPELPWTGERCLPWIEDVQVVYEHLLRYDFAAQFCAQKRAIDLGCGEGYGSAMLATSAIEVVGIEIDATVVAHAREAHRRPNLEFREGSVLDLDGIPAGSFDVAVCFEVLEHVDDHDRLLTGIRRLLTPDGLLLISTPDRVEYSERPGYSNPFHVRELDPAEFESLLRSHFRELATWRQATTSAGSRMVSERGREQMAGTRTTVVSRQGGEWVAGEIHAPYLLAVAGETLPVGLPERVELIDPGLEVVADKSARLNLQERQLGALHSELETSRSELAAGRSELAAAQAEAVHAQAEADTWRSRHDAATSTTGYRWLERLRRVRRLGRAAG